MQTPYVRMWQLLRPRRHLVAGTVFFALLAATTNAGYALVAGNLAQFLFGANLGVVSSSHFGWWPQGGAGGPAVILGLASLTTLRIIGTLGTAWVTARLGADISHELRTALYERTAANSLPRHLAHHRGDLVSRLQEDVMVVQDTLTYTVAGLAHTVLSSLMVGAVIITIDPVVGGACLLGAPLAALVVRQANRRFYQLYESLRADQGLLDGRIEEIVDVGDVVRSLGAEQRMLQRFNALSERVRKTSLSLAWTSSLTKPLISVAATLGIGVLILYWNLGHAPPPAEQAALLAAAAILIRPVHVASELVETMTSARRSLARIDEILATPMLTASSVPEGRRSSAQLFEARALSFAYADREVLSEVSFKLRCGEVLALVGPSGSGKTTLLRIVAGLLEPKQGQLEIDGRHVSDMGIRTYRSHFGWVPQEARLLYDKVAENLRLGRPDASTDDVDRALEAAGMRSAMKTFPAGLDTVVGDDGSPFSVGQRQRLCIARALVTSAPILIFDEPTAALDERQAEALHETLEGLRQGTAVLVATHRLSSVRRSDWVLVLEDGRIVEQGRPDELLASGPRFRRLFAQEIVELPANAV